MRPEDEVFMTKAMDRVIRQAVFTPKHWEVPIDFASTKKQASDDDVRSWQRASGPKGGAIAVMCGWDFSAKIGRVGVIEGETRGDLSRGDWQVCFDASAYRDHKVCSCSGGPSLYLPRALFVATGHRRLVRFWRWNRDGAGAGHGVTYDEEVDVWAIVDRTAIEYQRAAQNEIRKGLPK